MVSVPLQKPQRYLIGTPVPDAGDGHSENHARPGQVALPWSDGSEEVHGVPRREGAVCVLFGHVRRAGVEVVVY